MKYRQVCSLLGTVGLFSNVQESAALQLDTHNLLSPENQLVQLDENAEEDDSSALDGSGIKAKNIYGIPDDDEKNEALTQKSKKASAQKLTKKKASLKDAFVKFSKSLTEADFDAAVALKKDLAENDKVPQEFLDKVKVTTNLEMKKGFSFPEVAKNDFASNLFEEFEISEKNLNSNLDNVDLFNAFVEEADKVKKQLKEKYSDQWTDPADGDAPKLNEDEE